MGNLLLAVLALALAGCGASTPNEDMSRPSPKGDTSAPVPARAHARDNTLASRPAEGPGEVEGFQLQVSTDKSAYLPGEPIRAEITLTNVGATTVSVPFSNPPFAQYKIRVLDADDHPVPATPHGEEQMNPWKWSFGQRTLHPRGSI